MHHISGIPKVRFLDPSEIEKTIAFLVGLPDFSFALAGGAAMQVYGSSRFTEDVDVVADADIQHAALKKIRPLFFGGTRYMFSNDIPVDVIVRSDGYAELYKDALETSWTLKPVGLVVNPEHLLLMKFASNRDKDRLDFQWLATSGHPDLQKVKNLAFRLLGGQFAVERLIEAIAQAEFAKSREKNP